jgi:hypothetical protein
LSEPADRSAARRTPATAVLEALDHGARTRAEVAARAGLAADVVDALVEMLLRTGHLGAESLATTCPSGGCSGCGSPSGHGCATGAAARPSAVLLTRRHP